jgi:hypothetical protein
LTRWTIKCLLSALKSRGFNLEETNLTNRVQLENLLGLLCLAAFWAVRVGEFVSSLVPIQCKGHGRLAVSVFGVGLDALERVFRFDPLLGKLRGLVWDDALRLLLGTQPVDTGPMMQPTRTTLFNYSHHHYSQYDTV